MSYTTVGTVSLGIVLHVDCERELAHMFDKDSRSLRCVGLRSAVTQDPKHREWCDGVTGRDPRVVELESMFYVFLDFCAIYM